MRQVPEFWLPPNTILRVIRPLHGIAEVDTHWFNAHHRHHIERLNMEPSTFDLFFIYSKNSSKTNGNFGVIGLQTDDTLLAANQAFLNEKQKAVKEVRFLHKPLKILDENQPLNFNSTTYIIVENSIHITQKRQINCIKLTDTSLNTSILKTNYTAQRVRGAYVATISQPEASFFSFSSSTNHPADSFQCKNLK